MIFVFFFLSMESTPLYQGFRFFQDPSNHHLHFDGNLPSVRYHFFTLPSIPSAVDAVSCCWRWVSCTRFSSLHLLCQRGGWRRDGASPPGCVRSQGTDAVPPSPAPWSDCAPADIDRAELGGRGAWGSPPGSAGDHRASEEPTRCR